MNRDTSGGYGIDDPSSIPAKGKISLLQRPDGLWGPLSILCLGAVTLRVNSWSMKMTPRFLMRVFGMNTNVTSCFLYVLMVWCLGPGANLTFFNSVPRHEGVLGEWRYNSTHSLTSALDGGEWSASRPGHFTPRERALYPLERRQGQLSLSL
jgi:hypothetical protein